MVDGNGLYGSAILSYNKDNGVKSVMTSAVSRFRRASRRSIERMECQ